MKITTPSKRALDGYGRATSVRTHHWKVSGAPAAASLFTTRKYLL
jgi:hypothetical protein